MLAPGDQRYPARVKRPHALRLQRGAREVLEDLLLWPAVPARLEHHMQATLERIKATVEGNVS